MEKDESLLTLSEEIKEFFQDNLGNRKALEQESM